MSKPSATPQAKEIRKHFFIHKLPVILSNNSVFPKSKYDFWKDIPISFTCRCEYLKGSRQSPCPSTRLLRRYALRNDKGRGCLVIIQYAVYLHLSRGTKAILVARPTGNTRRRGRCSTLYPLLPFPYPFLHPLLHPFRYNWSRRSLDTHLL